MKTKRILSLAAATLLCLSTLLTTAAAAPIASRQVDVISLEDGSYYEISTVVYPTLTRASETYAEKEAVYYNSLNVKIYTYTLKGWFHYDGKTSKSTAVDTAWETYVDGVKCNFPRSSYSLNCVYGSATFTWPNHSSVDVTLTIKCDKDGNIT